MNEDKKAQVVGDFRPLDRRHFLEFRTDENGYVIGMKDSLALLKDDNGDIFYCF